MSLHSKEQRFYFPRKFRLDFAKSTIADSSLSVINRAATGTCLSALPAYLIFTYPSVGWIAYPIFLYFVGTRLFFRSFGMERNEAIKREMLDQPNYCMPWKSAVNDLPVKSLFNPKVGTSHTF